MVDVNGPDEPVEAYLDQLYASLRTTPRAARRIIAEAEDQAIVALAVALGFVPALRRTLLRHACG